MTVHRSRRPRPAPLAALLIALVLLGGCARLPWVKDAPKDPTPPPAPTLKVVVRGVEDRLADSVRAHVSAGSRRCDTPAAYLDELAGRAREEAQAALRAYGHYHAEVRARSVRRGDCPRVVVQVTPGPRVTVEAVTLDIRGPARDDATFMAALTTPPLRAGRRLNHAHYTATRRLVETVALERGYLTGHFSTHRLEVDPARNLARGVLVFESGPRFQVGEVRIDQEPAVVEDALVRRFLDYQPGQAYDATLVTRFYTALAASQYFDQVDIRPRLATPQGDLVPIDIHLTPRKRHRYSLGVGATTDEGLRTRAAYANRRVNVFGHRLKTELRGSLIEQSLSGEYQLPRAHPADEWLSFQAGVKRKDVDSFESNQTQAGVADTQRRPWGFLETRFVNLDYQAFDIGGRVRDSLLVIPGVRWVRSTANDPLYPTRGHTLNLELRGAAEELLSETSFGRFAASLRMVRGFGARWRLLTRADAGWSWSDDFGALPPTERFFAGGDQSIRGYDYQDLGPVNRRRNVIGGRYLGVVSAEIERTVARQWAVASFVDAGNAFGGNGRDTGVKVSLGAGLRWRSPLGPARIDLAHPLQDDVVLRLHVRIGPDL